MIETKSALPNQEDTNSILQNESADQTTPTEIELPKGVIHGYTLYLQVDDDNDLYEIADSQLADLETERNSRISCDTPAPTVTKWNTPWVKQDVEQQIGQFRKGAPYGSWDGQGNYTQYSAQVFSLYEDVEQGTQGKARNTETLRVSLHPRSHELETQNKNKYTWPRRRENGEMVEGTCIEIQTTFGRPARAIKQARHLLITAISETPSQVRDLLDDSNIMWDTASVSGLECHARHRRETLNPMAETLKRSTSLLTLGTKEGEEGGKVQAGEYVEYQFATENFEVFGFDSTVECTKTGFGNTASSTTELPKLHLKVYLHESANRFSEDHPLFHPKTEVWISGGAIPIDAFQAVHTRLSKFLNCFLYWAGITEEDLVADDYYKPTASPRQRITVPPEYEENLQCCYEDSDLKAALLADITKDCKNYHDILLAVKNRNIGITYDDLAEETGYSRDTVRQYVADLDEKYDFVKRINDIETYVAVRDTARDLVEDVFESARTIGSQIRDLASRASERRASRVQKKIETLKKGIRSRGGVLGTQSDEIPDDVQALAAELNKDPERVVEAISEIDSKQDGLMNRLFSRT